MTSGGILLWILFVVLQALDVATTTVILAAGGLELNPPEAWLQAKLGRAWWTVKLAIAIVGAGLAWWQFGWIGLAGIDGLFLCVVVFNLRSLR